MKTLFCKNCNELKPINSFWKSKTNISGYQTLCITCHTNKYKFKHKTKEDYANWAKLYRLKENNKEYERNFRKNYLQSFEGSAGKLLSATRNRAKKKQLEHNLDREWVYEKLKPMICNVTNIPLTLEKYENRKYHANPFNPSIDRIDSSKGYTKDNCRIVCFIYNMAKCDYDDSIVLKMAQALVNS